MLLWKMNALFILMKILCLSTYVSILTAKICTKPGGVLECCPGYVWNRIENRCLKWRSNALISSGDSPSEQSTLSKNVNKKLTTVSLESPDDVTATSSHSPYDMLFVTTIPFCSISVIISVTIICKQFRRRQGQVNVSTDAANYTAMQQDDEAHGYNSRGENLNPNTKDRGDRSNQRDTFPSITEEDGYITVL